MIIFKFFTQQDHNSPVVINITVLNKYRLEKRGYLQTMLYVK